MDEVCVIWSVEIKDALECEDDGASTAGPSAIHHLADISSPCSSRCSMSVLTAKGRFSAIDPFDLVDVDADYLRLPSSSATNNRSAWSTHEIEQEISIRSWLPNPNETRRGEMCWRSWRGCMRNG